MWKHGFVVREVHLVVTDSRLARNFYSLLLNTNPVVLKDKSYFNLEGSKLLLREDSHALKPPPGSSGLYHVAFVVDSLEGLAEVFRRILEYRLPLLGASDHGCTLALYTMDPDYNGVEIYLDKPVSSCKLRTKALDLDALSEVGGYKGYKVSIGHVHLKVPSLDSAEEFYSGTLRMRVTERGYPGALFLSYTDYHHHIGANVWETAWGARGARWRPGYVGLEKLVLNPPPDVDVVEGSYEDPAGHVVVVSRGGGPGGI